MFGIDFGNNHCVVAHESGSIVLNELGGMTSATLVAFKGRERLLGEAAVLSADTNIANTITFLPSLLGKTLEEIEKLGLPLKFPLEIENGQVVVKVDYNNTKQSFTLEQITAMLLGKFDTYAKAYGEKEEIAKYCIAIPCGWDENTKAAFQRAIEIAQLPKATLVTRAQALARCFHIKHPITQEDNANPEEKVLMIVDIGHVSTTITLIKLTATGEEVIATIYDGSFGSINCDKKLFDYFCQKILQDNNVDVPSNAKKSQRLMKACTRIKHLLSTASPTQPCCIQVENLGMDCDIPISITRNEFESLCENEANQLRSLLKKALLEANVDACSVESVEIVGGGTRIPFIQNAICETVHDKLGRRLDGTTAIAVGAAALAKENKAASPEDVDVEMPDTRNTLQAEIELELNMRQQDNEIAKIAEQRNKVESFIYDMRSQLHGQYAKKLDGSKLNPILDTAEGWLYSEEAENGTLEAVTTKATEIKATIQEACPEYFQAVDQKQKELEAELDIESKKAELEREANGEDEDHDFRKLKKPERMRLVMKNKDEGNELFRDGNHKHAAARYVKALSHASKFFDLSEDDKAEVKKIKLSLYLNLAQCYLKLENYHKVVLQCNDALDLDSANTKALYRRSLAYEKQRKFDDAEKDIEQASKLAPEDVAIKRLQQRIQAQLKRQLEKEKKMWSKAFA